jgi:hypothetical protein
MIKYRKQNLFPLSEPGTFLGRPIRYESAYETAHAQIDAERAAAEAAALKAQEEQRIAAEKAAAERAAAERAQAHARAAAAAARAREEAAAREAENRRHDRQLRLRRAAYRRRRELALQPPPLPPDASPLELHQRNCTVCSHPDRKSIEESFLRWDSTIEIADEYEISRSAVYRHAHALDLFDRRNRNVRFALGHLIEEASRVIPTADSIIRAVRAFTRVNDSGQWVDPPQHFIVSAGPRIAGPADLPIGVPLAQFASHGGQLDHNPAPSLLAPSDPAPGNDEDPSTQTGTASWTHPGVTP